jgi:A/G-specific adenine glycosylase
MIQPLVAWFEEHQRALPWRHGYDPYQVWVSEVMLQQTQVETVLPYFARFIEAFPGIRLLADAEEAQVLRLWAGLGYYRRAKNLHSAARLVQQLHGGVIPSDYDALIALPGVGQYMAGAILSIAFNKPYPVVDGNVRRVLSRIHGWMDENPKALWQAAEQLARSAEPRIVNQGLMELGATVCSFRAPRCLVCPVQQFCVAFKTGMQTRIPPIKKRPATIHLHLHAVVQQRGSRFLMRAVDGMWEFPTFSELPPGEFTKTGSCRHTITHHRLDVSVYVGSLASTEEYRWKDIAGVPVTSLTRKILAASNGRGLAGPPPAAPRFR